jgi:hypothetical protein
MDISAVEGHSPAAQVAFTQMPTIRSGDDKRFACSLPATRTTESDGYGGQTAVLLMMANEAICKDLLDADLRAAIARFVDA